MGSGVGYYQRKSGHDSRRSRTSGTGYSGSYLLAVQHEVLMHVISRVKAMLPRCVVALGGPEFLGHNEDFLRTNRFVDCVFRGEGEETFPQWLACWQQPKEWTRITGLCFLDAEGQYHDNGLSRVMAFDKLVNPEQSPFFNWSKPFVQLETTRGCFNTCAFCVSGGEKPVRTLSVEAIRERVRLIHEKGIRNIRVLDRTFNYQSHRAKALFDLFREFPDMRFHLEIHPALLSEELKKELASMPKGLLHLEAGIQSLHEEVLTVSRRAGKLADALEGLRYLCALDNMETHADLIAGLPLYHLSQIFDDVRTLAEYRAGEIQLESLKLLPGTEMRRRAEELGICYSPLPPYEVLQTREITPRRITDSPPAIASARRILQRTGLAGNHPPSDCGRARLSDTFPGSPDSNRDHRPAHGTGATGYPALPFLQGALPSFPDRHEPGMD